MSSSDCSVVARSRARGDHGSRCVLTAIACLALLGSVAEHARADTIYVDASAGAGGNGQSWATAYRFLQDALLTATAGDRIWVADGTYLPDQDELGSVTPGDRAETFTLVNGVALLGGFVGGEANEGDRDVAGNPPAILSGNIGAPGDDADNSFHVVTGSGTDATAVIDGFTIQEGRTDCGPAALAPLTTALGVPAENGAGMIIEGGSPTIVACIFRDDIACGRGGGLFADGSSAPVVAGCRFEDNDAFLGGGLATDGDGTFVGCTFIDNFAGTDGGGAHVGGGSPTFRMCLFDDNDAKDDGGGAATDADEPTIEDCVFENNDAGSEGGGLFHCDGTLTVNRCAFIGNDAPEGGGFFNDYDAYLNECLFRNNEACEGGGSYNDSCLYATRCDWVMNTAFDGGGHFEGFDSYLTNCRFVGNQAIGDGKGGGDGGAIFSDCACPYLVNCLVSGNEALDDGGGVYYQESFGAFCDSTFTQNIAGDRGGAIIATSDAEAPFSNCILWGDTAKDGSEVAESGGSDFLFQNCDVQGSGGSANWDTDFGTDLGGNIDADPLFTNAPGADGTPGTLDDDVSLRPGSPCVDAGSNALLPEDLADLDGDEDTAETLPLDLLDNPRVVDGTIGPAGAIVDIGAIELRLLPPGPTGERAHPGWNWLDNGITLTANQPIYWSALTGQPAGLSPFTVLDPTGMGGPGRPAMDGTGDRVLRGYIVGWAVSSDGAEIRWNQLAGNATVVHYANGSAWEYNTINHAVVANVAEGAEPDAMPGRLLFDGAEYAPSFDELLFNFQAAGSLAYGMPGQAPRTVVSDTDLTLVPLSADLRQENDGPITTKADATVWNQNEVKLSGTHRCITCWDQTLLSLYFLPGPVVNHFVRAALQTDHGKARIDGVASIACDVDFDPGDGLPLGADPRDVVSEAAALLGVAARQLTFDPGMANADRGAAGYNLVGMGSQGAVIEYDLPPGGQEAQGGRAIPGAFAGGRTLASSSAVDPRDGRFGHRVNGEAPAAAMGPGGQDRGSATEKGSFFIFPAVEIRWGGAAPYPLLQDTFLSLTNDGIGDVHVQLYFINGDPPLPAVP